MAAGEFNSYIRFSCVDSTINIPLVGAQRCHAAGLHVENFATKTGLPSTIDHEIGNVEKFDGKTTYNALRAKCLASPHFPSSIAGKPDKIKSIMSVIVTIDRNSVARYFRAKSALRRASLAQVTVPMRLAVVNEAEFAGQGTTRKYNSSICFYRGYFTFVSENPNRMQVEFFAQGFCHVGIPPQRGDQEPGVIAANTYQAASGGDSAKAHVAAFEKMWRKETD